MKLTAAILALFLLDDPVVQTERCVNVCYMHIEDGRPVDSVWFEGRLEDGLPPWKGFVKGLQPGKCLASVVVMEDGFYSVSLPAGYILDGHGWRDTIYVHPNQMPSQTFYEIKNATMLPP